MRIDTSPMLPATSIAASPRHAVELAISIATPYEGCAGQLVRPASTPATRNQWVPA
jgi:hypothetical protein